MVALNTETENDDGSEHQKWKAMVALNAETKNDDGGSKRRNWEWWWLWTPNLRMMMASKAETKNDDGTKRRNWEAMKALNAKNEKWW